ncbi:MAG: phosphopantothenoylcysteine decarboxylase [Tetragenococcus halophilus]|nr:phosphopantothenoylcysteine decarboxylase [Tetragenococcus sp.]MDN6839494.1 phosphopantothenoylcysteine decarboxylase [Tetragenococcus halophilus]
MTKHILLGVTGSISAYKSADLANHLTKKGYAVDVLMSKSSQEFITPLTLQSLTHRKVHTDVMEEPDPSKINHIELTKPADLFLVAPATANIIGKLANGLADNLISTVALALPSDRAKLIAPAMNSNMYEHPIVQKNLRTLKDMGYKVIDPRESLLACGDFGPGALANDENLIEEAINTLEGKEA